LLRWRLSLFGDHDETGSAPPDDDDVLPAQPAAELVGGRARLRYDVSEELHVEGDVGATWSQRSRLDHLAFSSAPSPSSLVLGRIGVRAENLPLSVDTASVWLRSRWLTVDGFDTAVSDVSEVAGFTLSGLSSSDADVGVDAHFALPGNAGIGLGANTGVALVVAPFMHPDENGKARSNVGAYVNGDVEFFDSVRAFAGVRVDRTATLQEPELSYRLGALWYASMMSVRLSADSAVREPTWAEVGARLIDPETGLILLEGNPELKAPTLESVELAVIVAPTSTLRLQPTLFAQYARDLIGEDFSPLVKKTFVNQEEGVFMLGAELEAEWNFLDDLYLVTRFGSVLWPLAPADDAAAAVGDVDQNSRAIGYAGVRGRLFDGRLGAALGAGFATPRVYRVETGIPPRILDEETGQQGFVEVAADAQPDADVPMFITLKVRAVGPGGVVEAPFPGSSAPASRALIGIEYRP
jgi:hypothetical protein